jgi:hypothetical protein
MTQNERSPLTTKQLKRRYWLLRKLGQARSLRQWARTQPGGEAWLERKRARRTA